jgi:hypothetical protein
MEVLKILPLTGSPWQHNPRHQDHHATYLIFAF